MENDFLGIADWVRSMLGQPQHIRGSKAFHDHVLGTHVFEPHEVTLLNTPLLQRLRYLSQTGFVYLTFPGARHTRFEHTLGTAILAKRFCRALNEGAGKQVATGEDVRELRVAALLHDSGHAFFSHSSEAMYRHTEGFKRMQKEPRFASKGAGELLSYAIVTSQPFREFFSELCKMYRLDLNLDRIAGYIIGKRWTDDKAYMAEIISGPFDVDKLDYVHRDAHATGLKLVVDLERFFYAIRIAPIEGQMRLAINSPEPLEQLIFSKMLLFSTVYHHHKVKACDCLLKGAVDWANREKQPIMGYGLTTPTDYLSLTDIDVLAVQGNPLLRRLRDRKLLYRAAAICVDTVEGWSDDSGALGIYGLLQDIQDPGKLKSLNQAIYDILPIATRDKVLPEEIWVDVPDLPKLKELSLANVCRNGTTTPAETLHPTNGWLAAYRTYRTKGHVFSPPEVAAEVYQATKIVFHDKFGISFRDEQVHAICHW